MASGLVNEGMEALYGYRKVLTALNVHQQSILRKSGPFVNTTASKAATKPSKDKATTCARSLAVNAAKRGGVEVEGERSKVYLPR